MSLGTIFFAIVAFAAAGFFLVAPLYLCGLSAAQPLEQDEPLPVQTNAKEDDHDLR